MEKENKDQIIQIWESYSSHAEEITAKRQNINTLFITIEIAILGFVINDLKTLGLCLSIAGLIVSVAWVFMVLAYRKLNTAKFEVINQIEEKMDIKPYRLEWDSLKKKKYIGLTIIEMLCSSIFTIGFIITLILSILKINNII
ncbi:MAG: hypothetical protein K6E87_06175 [bacterium]|nr:hypothetical protein [bacterium]